MESGQMVRAFLADRVGEAVIVVTLTLIFLAAVGAVFHTNFTNLLLGAVLFQSTLAGVRARGF
jgi:hypothetical protein